MAFCQANRLTQTAKWLGELLVTVKAPGSDGRQGLRSKPGNVVLSADDHVMTDDHALQEVFADSLDESDLSSNSTKFAKVFFERPSESMDKLNLARVLFDLREYRKCAHTLQSLPSSNQSALFLRSYATFLACQQRSEEESLESGDKIQAQSQSSQGSISSQSKEIAAIEQTLSRLRQEGKLDAINLYLLGVLLKQKDCKSEAREVLVEALNKMPLLWSAWLELGSLTTLQEARVFDKLRDHWAKNFWLACFFLDMQQAKDAFELNCSLYETFKGSVFIMNQIAHASYVALEYDIAIDWFQRLLKQDPFRYENLDLYTNILYIKEKYGELSNLAFNVFQNDKYRPEACCVVGNYYSLRGDHQKSALYFMRAIKLDKKFVPAWTLMGHEYLEMKNVSAAIESYRTAVDADPTDFRAWYGLGQAYEMSGMYGYAAHYFANAALAKPSDARMWNAMANCYHRLDKKAEAKKCTERALRFKDKEGIALHKLAKLHLSTGDRDAAAACFELNLKRKGAEDSSEVSEALKFLAEFCRETGKFEPAMAYARQLHERFVTEREEAGRMIREISR